jgi:hypothetical protein
MNSEQEKPQYIDDNELWTLDPSGDERATVGPLSLVIMPGEAWQDGLTRLGAEIEKNPKHIHNSNEAARLDAEQILREMYNKLSKRFAPALRWIEGVDEANAMIPSWWLRVRRRSDGMWLATLEAHGAQGPVFANMASTISEAKAALENELGFRGVVLRVVKDQER